MQRLFDAFKKADKDLFLVGGAVRDLALGIEMKDLDDLDFCTNALPEETLEILKTNHFSTYEMGFEFGTVGATLRGKKKEGFPKDVQVTTYRSAEYYRRGSRHPEVKFGTTIAQDLKRRDFSINSIALDADGNFFDPYDGLGDLKRGLLRVVSDPLETLAEDPLRILRVARFVSRFGFEIDPLLKDAARARSKNISDISHERWLQETNKLLVGKYIQHAIDFLSETGVLHIILPELWTELDPPNRVPEPLRNTVRIAQNAPKDVTLRWGILLHQIADSKGIKNADKAIAKLAKRFTFDNEMAKGTRAINRFQKRIFEYDPRKEDPFLRRLFIELNPHFDLMCAFAEAKNPDFDVKNLRERIEKLNEEGSLIPTLPTGIGAILMEEFQLKPSKKIGLFKTFLENEIIEGNLGNALPVLDYVEYLKSNYPEES